MCSSIERNVEVLVPMTICDAGHEGDRHGLLCAHCLPRRSHSLCLPCSLIFPDITHFEIIIVLIQNRNAPKKQVLSLPHSKKHETNNTPDVFVDAKGFLYSNNLYVPKCVFLALLKFSSSSLLSRYVPVWSGWHYSQRIAAQRRRNWTSCESWFVQSYFASSTIKLNQRGGGGGGGTDSARSSRGLVSSSRQFSRTSAAWSQDGLSPPAL